MEVLGYVKHMRFYNSGMLILWLEASPIDLSKGDNLPRSSSVPYPLINKSRAMVLIS